jgi:hypothetical protein
MSHARAVDAITLVRRSARRSRAVAARCARRPTAPQSALVGVLFNRPHGDIAATSVTVVVVDAMMAACGPQVLPEELFDRRIDQADKEGRLSSIGSGSGPIIGSQVWEQHRRRRTGR